MSGRMKENGKITKLLDMLLNKRYFSFWTPIAVAAIAYGLFLIFGENPDKGTLAVQAPIFALLWCLAVFLVLGLQLINPLCSAGVMDIFELITLIILYWSSTVTVVAFLFDMREGFTQSTLGTILPLSVLSVIHSLRK